MSKSWEALGKNSMFKTQTLYYVLTAKYLLEFTVCSQNKSLPASLKWSMKAGSNLNPLLLMGSYFFIVTLCQKLKWQKKCHKYEIVLLETLFTLPSAEIPPPAHKGRPGPKLEKTGKKKKKRQNTVWVLIYGN